MKKILVVFTGGTIGSAASKGTINTSDKAAFQLLAMFQAHYPDHAAIHFDTIQPIQILSENLAPTAWETIIAAIESKLSTQYDGIIVTHGTDTLAYTANVLSFYFSTLALPLLLVSSDYPLDNPKGNGLANFICAVAFIRQTIANGVFVPYRNAGQTMQIHRGSRLTSSLQLSGDFYSVQGKSLMQFDGQHFTFTDAPVVDNPKSGDQANNRETKNAVLLKPQFSKRVLMIKPYPGLDYSHYQLDDCDAVLHDLYHSGTACVTGQWGQNYSLIAFIKACKAKKIAVYLAPAIQTENAYQSTHELVQHGAIIIWNMSIEAAYVKLLLAYDNFSEQTQIDTFMEKDIAFEHVGLF